MLLEYAADIVTGMKHANGKPNDAREKELLSLLFQILSLRFSTGAGTAEADAAISAEDWKAGHLLNFRTLQANRRAI
jgi:hypothetical protein